MIVALMHQSLAHLDEFDRRHHVVIHVVHDPDRAEDDQAHDEEAEGEREHVVGVIRCGGQARSSIRASPPNGAPSVANLEPIVESARAGWVSSKTLDGYKGIQDTIVQWMPHMPSVVIGVVRRSDDPSVQLAGRGK
jgi:hypothetical protein